MPTRAPYAPPGSDAALAADQANLREIARRLRGINIAILVILTAYVGVGAGIAMQGSPWLLIVGGVVVFAMNCAILFDAAKLAQALSGSATTGVLVGALLFLMPCAGLLGLLILGQSATTRLRAAGYRVGLLGAKL